MSLRLARRAGDAAAALDPLADTLQAAARSLPRPLRDVLDGVWLGAPLHPALTDVPLGSWTAAAAFDAFDAGDAADAAIAVGVLGAVPAALTGLNDWSHLRGDSKRIGTVHALLNATGLVLNVASLALRRGGRRDLGRVLSSVAYGGALVSAHLGGQLSFGLGVRVNRTAFESPEQEWQAVLDEGELGPRELRRVEVDGEPALLARATDGRICAIAATCTHLGGPLHEGERDGDVVVCPWHGSRFDLCSGGVRGGPAVFPQPRYEVRVREGRIELRPEPNT
ncbi:MAG TPA: Rieske (2Fe-2S) protein [Gaiellaceae bacterium]|nr:Rieske (2Fe-2S) protein [Gaiellaceae bacterium]